MKICKQCGKRYTDPTLNFCLDDGAVLSITNSPEIETVLRVPRAEPAPSGTKNSETKVSTYGKVAFWSGIISIPASFCYLVPGLPFALTALITGHIGRKNAKSNPNEYAGLAKATTGFIIGLIVTSLQVLFFALAIFLTATGRLPDNRNAAVNASTTNTGSNPTKIIAPSQSPAATPSPSIDPAELSSRENLDAGGVAYSHGDFEKAKAHFSAIKSGTTEYAPAQRTLIEIERSELATAKENLAKFKRIAQSMNDTYGMNNNIKRIRELEAEIKRREQELASRSKRLQ